MNRRILLWRHGRTAWNADGRIQGQLDVPLDAEGVAQARAAAPRLAELSPSVVLSSDLRRAAVTADELARVAGLTARVETRLREVDLGGWQGLTSEQAAIAFPAEHAAWQAGLDVRRGGGETYAEVALRSVAALDAVLVELADDALVVAVTHGGTARATIGALLELEPNHWWRLAPLGNCRWSLLRDTGRGWRLAGHNVRAC